MSDDADPVTDSPAPKEPSPPENSSASKDAGRARIDRARLARIFGEVLPETTRDERGEGDPVGESSDDWLRRQVPPHHSKQ